MAPLDDRIVTLPDGRSVAVATYGDRTGRPVIFCHGAPVSRIGNDALDEPARVRNVRVLCLDRPGIGRTDPGAMTTVADVVADVGAVADLLGLGRFEVIGYSCGGPYALACAARLGDRVTAVATMAGAGPLDRPGARDGLSKSDLRLLDLSTRRPRAAAALLRVQALAARRAPGLAVKALAGELGPADGEALRDGLGALTMRSFVEALRQGPAGAVDEYLRWGARPWGFDFSAVQVPVHVFQGEADRMVPIHHAQDLVARTPHAALHLLPGEGHISIQRRAGDILDALPAAA